MARRVLILGSWGQLGAELVKQWPQADEVIGLGHHQIEIADQTDVDCVLHDMAPQLVINCTAYHKVDEMESHANRALEVNALGPLYLARWCAAHGARLAHFSTDYVFGRAERRVPYEESDRTDPLNVYGASKAAGEQLVRQATADHLIIRSSGLYGLPSRAGNFVRNMLRLAAAGQPIKVVEDQVLTPTSCLALARQTVALLRTEAQGTFHATCQGQCSWYEFAAAIFRLRGLTVELGRQSSADSGAKARRPAYSVLENAHLHAMGLDQMPDWEQALAEYLHGL